MFSERIVGSLAAGSSIRAMFEQGNLLKQTYGEDNVYDFALGNPDPEPPQTVIDDLRARAAEPGIHKYMPNAGFPDVRAKIAAYLKKETGVDFTDNHIMMVTGAAAGLSVTMDAILNPGEEVVVIAPFFGEYKGYVTNFGGKIIPVPALPGTFALDVPAIEKALTRNTKAIILNSPNNPSGAVYDEASLKSLNAALERAEAIYGQPIYVVSDEPYVRIVYDGVKVPAMSAIFKNSIVVNSFSKSLALPGERIGYVAVNPAIRNADVLMDALIFCNRTLGFVNAPGIFQKVVADHLEDVAGLEAYKERRDALYEILIETGYRCALPKGAFYLFPQSPVPDDAAFCNLALKHRLVIVSGTGFSYPGYFRLAYCVSMKTIKNSKDAFAALLKEATGK
ncbi:MAG: pyridoxal phosphate-dependent aminotransferase [Clostridia bacterium]